MAPAGVYDRLKAYYAGEKEPEVPAINTSLAVTLLVVYTLVYVLPFYVSSTTRPSPTLSRDAPSVIRGRIQAVTVSCIICSVTTFVVLASVGEDGPIAAPIKVLHKLGYFPIGIYESAKVLLLTAILFLGPLFEAGCAEGKWRDWIQVRGLNATIRGWIGYRNFIAGPITEEVLFRSASVPLLLLAQTGNTTIIFLTPIIFGLAHVHHFYEFRITHPHTPLIGAILRTLLQLTYTTLFGGYATFLYLRTGSLLGVILVHSFCNMMGFPRFWGRVTAGDDLPEPEFGGSKRSEDRNPTSNGKLGILWSFAYYILLVVGALSWWHYLWSLTSSELALTSFNAPSKA
ncbi:Prenyl -specific endoprotease 2 [Hyphodiscus hymeniophilus]|uniref:intramembrane prenyl-peptidase Rce1 n=1 Tax=Hyphodiscus hymeniophilus TaxID=353542 RepID=A0A9P7AWI2_9HELO|nr:Prenyl -specific endoprotease 2 [Hyphodiscus hymeniophilus]